MERRSANVKCMRDTPQSPASRRLPRSIGRTLRRSPSNTRCRPHPGSTASHAVDAVTPRQRAPHRLPRHPCTRLPPFRTFATVYPMANVRNGGTCEVPRAVSTNTDGCVKYRRRRSVFHASIGISAGGGRVRAKRVYREHRGGVAWGGLDTALRAYSTSSGGLPDQLTPPCRLSGIPCEILPMG